MLLTCRFSQCCVPGVGQNFSRTFYRASPNLDGANQDCWSSEYDNFKNAENHSTESPVCAWKGPCQRSGSDPYYRSRQAMSENLDFTLARFRLTNFLSWLSRYLPELHSNFIIDLNATATLRGPKHSSRKSSFFVWTIVASCSNGRGIQMHAKIGCKKRIIRRRRIFRGTPHPSSGGCPWACRCGSGSATTLRPVPVLAPP